MAVARRATTELDESGAWSFVKLTNGSAEVHSTFKQEMNVMVICRHVNLTCKHGRAQATVYLRGAHVTSFKVADVEWIGMRTDCKLDGSKQNISGGMDA